MTNWQNCQMQVLPGCLCDHAVSRTSPGAGNRPRVIAPTLNRGEVPIPAFPACPPEDACGMGRSWQCPCMSSDAMLRQADLCGTLLSSKSRFRDPSDGAVLRPIGSTCRAVDRDHHAPLHQEQRGHGMPRPGDEGLRARPSSDRPRRVAEARPGSSTHALIPEDSWTASMASWGATACQLVQLPQAEPFTRCAQTLVTPRHSIPTR